MAAKLTREEKYMKAAIREAKKAWALGEVPIGCVIVYEDKIIGRGYNRRMVDHSALAHAEIAAIKKHRFHEPESRLRRFGTESSG